MTIREGAATARAAMVLELMIGGLDHEGAEAKVAAYDQARRAEVLREAADGIAAMIPALQREYPDEPSNSPWACGVADAATELRRMAERSET